MKARQFLTLFAVSVLGILLAGMLRSRSAVNVVPAGNVFWGSPDTPGQTIQQIYITSNYVTYITIETNTFEVDPSMPLGFYMVPTRADLTLVATNNMLTRAVTSGWLVPGDGGGRFYRFDWASTDSELDADSNLRLDTVTPYDISGGALVNPATAGRWLESNY